MKTKVIYNKDLKEPKNRIYGISNYGYLTVVYQYVWQNVSWFPLTIDNYWYEQTPLTDVRVAQILECPLNLFRADLRYNKSNFGRGN